MEAPALSIAAARPRGPRTAPPADDRPEPLARGGATQPPRSAPARWSVAGARIGEIPVDGAAAPPYRSGHVFQADPERGLRLLVLHGGVARVARVRGHRRGARHPALPGRSA